MADLAVALQAADPSDPLWGRQEAPGWWLLRLGAELLERRRHLADMAGYLDGTHLAPNLASKATRFAYSKLRAMSGTNFAELVVEAPRERMRPVGFRTGAEGGQDGDQQAWRIWQSNSLDADSALIHRTALGLGRAFVIVGGVDPEIGAPVISIEDPAEVIVSPHPIYRRRARAALKLFREDGIDRAYVYVPGEVWRFERVRGLNRHDVPLLLAPSEWQVMGDPVRVPDGLVPVVEFANKPSIKGEPAGEIEAHLSILDRIDYQILQQLQIATLQAFRQRAVKGMPNTDEHGNEIDYSDIFAADPGALWLLPDTADLWESGQVDLGPVRQAIKDDVQNLAAVTRTPLFYLSPDAASGSAEGASLAREGLVFRTEDRISQMTEAWERVMSYAFRFAGDPERAAMPDMEVLWAPVERFSLGERYDAASKATAAGVPWRTVMQDVLGFSPQQVDRMEAERLTDAILAPPVAPVSDGFGG